MRCLFIFLWLTMGALPSWAAEVRETVVSVNPDQTITLAHAGKARFADIVFPDAALAQPWLAAHVLQQEITYEAGNNDRYGRLSVTSPQEQEMLRAGVAVLFNQTDVEADWLTAEREAQKAYRGVWANKNFILTPENAAQHFSEFHVIEGTVLHIYDARTATYLNFGENWHTDFSIVITGRERRQVCGVAFADSRG